MLFSKRANRLCCSHSSFSGNSYFVICDVNRTAADCSQNWLNPLKCQTTNTIQKKKTGLIPCFLWGKTAHLEFSVGSFPFLEGACIHSREFSTFTSSSQFPFNATSASRDFPFMDERMSKQYKRKTKKRRNKSWTFHSRRGAAATFECDCMLQFARATTGKRCDKVAEAIGLGISVVFSSHHFQSENVTWWTCFGILVSWRFFSSSSPSKFTTQMPFQWFRIESVIS